MEAKIRYIWLDEEDNERISKNPPINECRSPFGGLYTPHYEKVVLITVKEE